MVDTLKKNFGRTVRALRERQEVSLRQFALMINLDKSYLIDIELGRSSATLDTIQKIAAGLDIPISELFRIVEAEEELYK